jgi:hypothetical protein
MHILTITRWTGRLALGLSVLGPPVAAMPRVHRDPGAGAGEAAIAAVEAFAQQELQEMQAADVCTQTAFLASYGSFLGLQEDLNVAEANCLNLTDRSEAQQCMLDAADAFQQGFDEIVGQFQQRKEICSLLGGGPYDPEIEKSDFKNPKPNPLFPLVPGTTWTYHEPSPDGLQVNVVTVTGDTKLIDDIKCRAVHDTVSIGGVLIEDTIDYFAGDKFGNVWYFGEHSESLEDGVIVSLDGSFLADVDGGKAGIIMLAAPTVGTSYRQEFMLNEAEDCATVDSLDVTVTVPFGTFQHCLKTREFSGLEPGVVEFKYYAPGFGVVKEDTEFNTSSVLVDFHPGGG